jgi:hypothetical protein
MAHALVGGATRVVIYSDAEALDRRYTEANTQAPPLSRARAISFWAPYGIHEVHAL